MSEQPFISIIIPAYNEAKRLPSTLEQISTYLQKQDYSYEIIIVENGSTDNTLEIAQEFAQNHDFIRPIHEEQNGKGRAVRRGIFEARGEFCFMCDADLSMPIEELSKFLPPAIPEPQIVIGSREAPGAVRYNEPSYRHWGGRLVNLIIQILALPGFHDTQCGFKLFRRDLTLPLFEQQTLMGWSFDIEILFLARKANIQIKEIPVHWHYGEESHVNPLPDTIKLILDIVAVRWRSLKGYYAQKKV